MKDFQHGEAVEFTEFYAPKDPFEIPVKVLRDSETAKIPTYGTSGAVGFDIYSDEDVQVWAFPTRISTGLKIELPFGYGLFIIPRSGAASKQLYVANTPGLVDHDYRGLLQVLVWTNCVSGYEISRGDRIAQGFVLPVPRVKFIEVDSLSSTERGEGGFGSTGA
jgi:dUTP pyrophosphatase